VASRQRSRQSVNGVTTRASPKTQTRAASIRPAAATKMSASKRVRRAHLHFGVSVPPSTRIVRTRRFERSVSRGTATRGQTLVAPSTGRMNHRARCSPPQFAHVPTPWSLRFRFAWTEHLRAIDGSLCRHPKSRSTGLTIASAGWNVNQVGTLNQSGWGQLPAAVLAEQ
jgi:hypothetical protein